MKTLPIILAGVGIIGLGIYLMTKATGSGDGAPDCDLSHGQHYKTSLEALEHITKEKPYVAWCSLVSGWYVTAEHEEE